MAMTPEQAGYIAAHGRPGAFTAAAAGWLVWLTDDNDTAATYKPLGGWHTDPADGDVTPVAFDGDGVGCDPRAERGFLVVTGPADPHTAELVAAALAAHQRLSGRPVDTAAVPAAVREARASFDPMTRLAVALETAVAQLATPAIFAERTGRTGAGS